MAGVGLSGQRGNVGLWLKNARQPTSDELFKLGCGLGLGTAAERGGAAPVLAKLRDNSVTRPFLSRCDARLSFGGGAVGTEHLGSAAAPAGDP